MAHVTEINKQNLRQLAWKRGFHGVSGLAKSIGRSRVTLHRAVRWPDQYAPTMRAIKKALL